MADTPHSEPDIDKIKAALRSAGVLHDEHETMTKVSQELAKHGVASAGPHVVCNRNYCLVVKK